MEVTTTPTHDGSASDEAPLLAMNDIIVRFGGVDVLKEAGIEVRRGEVHALLGENGAGKSSLMKVLFGLYEKAAGHIALHGERVAIGRPQDALDRGIAMIHQELPFALHLSTAENIFLGREKRSGFGLVDHSEQQSEALDMLDPFPIDIDVSRPMAELSVAERQIVAIAKAVSTGADIIILDEATTALTGRETERLFDLLEELKAEGKTFIMITHKLDEVFEVADRVTVLRDGELVAALTVADTTPDDVVRHMVGREVEEVFPDRTTRTDEDDPPLLSVENLSTRKLSDISLEVRAGEVVGVAGLMGAGRTSLFDALFGVIPHEAVESVRVRGEPVSINSPADAIDAGIAYITEDRKGSGLALDLGVRDNVALPQTRDFARMGLIRDGALREMIDRFEEKLKIVTTTSRTTGYLSGGNQQKVVLAKWLATGADVYLMDEPTRGIDVGTKMDVYHLINELTDNGKAVLLVTSELPELRAMSDRYVVLSEGNLVRRLSKEEGTAEEIMYYASQKPESIEAPA
jgi:ABC-type sugar transport system ATPase subunit